MAFPFNAKFRLLYHNDTALKSLPTVLARELKGTMKGLGNRLTASAALRMRKDTGDEIKTLVSEVTGQGLDYSLAVYSTALKAFIDAYGMRPGTRVPYGFGSRLQTWAQRKVRVGESRTPRVLTEPYAGAGPPRVFQSVSKVERVRGIKGPRKSRVTKSAKVKGVNRTRNKGRAAQRLAYLTAKAIYERGLQASHWNKAALEANRARILRDLQNAISRAVNKVNRGH